MPRGLAQQFALAARAMRLPFVAASVLPYALGVAAAEGRLGYPVWVGGLTVAVGHLMANLLNELADDASGADHADPVPYGFFGGSKLLPSGRLSTRWYLVAAVICLAVCAGGVITVACAHGSWLPVVAGTAGCLLGVFYSLPPGRFMCHGTGELAVWLAFGPVAVGAGMFCRSGGVAPGPVLVYGAFAGSLTAAILVAGEVPDGSADASVGKRHLVVRTGPAGAAWIFTGLCFLAAAVVLPGVLRGDTPVFSLVALLPLWSAPSTARTLRRPGLPRAAYVPVSRRVIFMHHLCHILLIAVLCLTP